MSVNDQIRADMMEEILVLRSELKHYKQRNANLASQLAQLTVDLRTLIETIRVARPSSLPVALHEEFPGIGIDLELRTQS